MSGSAFVSRRIVFTALAILCTTAVYSVFGGTSARAEALPDGRVYEMVTPPENEDASVYVPLAVSEGVLNAGQGGTHTKLPFQVAPSGEAVAYLGDSTVGGSGDAGAGLGNEYLATRNPGGGWSQTNVQPAGLKSAFYEAFSPDLSAGFLNAGYAEEARNPLTSPLVPGEETLGGGYADIYVYSAGRYRPLVTEAPSEPAGEFITYGVPVVFDQVEAAIQYAGASKDLSELLFEAHGKLTPNSLTDPEVNNLYVSSAGGLTLVNVLPSGVGDPNATFGAPRTEADNEQDLPDFERVISSDGSRIFWTDLNTAVSAEDPAGKTRLFVREHAGAPQSPLGPSDECLVSTDACTVQLDRSQAGGGGGGGRYWTATADGSQVFFTDDASAQLTANTEPGSGENLYEYDLDSGQLTDLTGATASAAVQGLLGASEDGSYVYFVAQGVLGSGEANGEGARAEAGQDNLYVSQPGGAPVFITVLSPQDDTQTLAPGGFPGYFGDWQPGLGHRTAEVTPDGRHLVFESNAQDVGGDAPEFEDRKLQEVYVYEAGGGLVCASCGPRSQAPQLNQEAEKDIGAFLPISWSTTYRPQWISNDGDQVFFDDAQPLSAADTNATPDVYEWERGGAGSCTAGGGGCDYLLSGGLTGSASWLLGASATGSDVFIVSRARLTPTDGDDAYNLFDARVDGFSPPAEKSCTGTGCQGVPAPPPTFATPPSVTFAGVGNFPAPAPATAPTVKKAKSKPLSAAQKLAKALRTCHKKRSRTSRSSCERQARERYRSSRAKKSNLDRRTGR